MPKHAEAKAKACFEEVEAVEAEASSAGSMQEEAHVKSLP